MKKGLKTLMLCLFAGACAMLGGCGQGKTSNEAQNASYVLQDGTYVCSSVKDSDGQVSFSNDQVYANNFIQFDTQTNTLTFGAYLNESGISAGYYVLENVSYTKSENVVTGTFSLGESAIDAEITVESDKKVVLDYWGDDRTYEFDYCEETPDLVETYAIDHVFIDGEESTNAKDSTLSLNFETNDADWSAYSNIDYTFKLYGNVVILGNDSITYVGRIDITGGKYNLLYGTWYDSSWSEWLFVFHSAV